MNIKRAKKLANSPAQTTILGSTNDFQMAVLVLLADIQERIEKIETLFCDIEHQLAPKNPCSPTLVPPRKKRK